MRKLILSAQLVAPRDGMTFAGATASETPLTSFAGAGLGQTFGIGALKRL